MSVNGKQVVSKYTNQNLLEKTTKITYNEFTSGSSSVVERLLPKQKVVGSNPISRSIPAINHSYAISKNSTQNPLKECLLRQKMMPSELSSLASGYSLCAQTVRHLIEGDWEGGLS